MALSVLVGALAVPLRVSQKSAVPRENEKIRKGDQAEQQNAEERGGGGQALHAGDRSWRIGARRL